MVDRTNSDPRHWGGDLDPKGWLPLPPRFRVDEVRRFQDLGSGAGLVEVGEASALRNRALVLQGSKAGLYPRLLFAYLDRPTPSLLWDLDLTGLSEVPPFGSRSAAWCQRQVRRLADGLSQLHANGVVHGRLVRSAFLLDEDDLVVQDFGSLQPRLRRDHDWMVLARSASGAPECDRFVDCADLAALDVFAVGVLALELFSGQPAATLSKQEQQGVTRSWPAALRDCLRFSPEDRPRDLSVLADRLSSWCLR